MQLISLGHIINYTRIFEPRLQVIAQAKYAPPKLLITSDGVLSQCPSDWMVCQPSRIRPYKLMCRCDMLGHKSIKRWLEARLPDWADKEIDSIKTIEIDWDRRETLFIGVMGDSHRGGSFCVNWDAYAENPCRPRPANKVFCWAANEAPRLRDYPINLPSPTPALEISLS